MLTRIFLIRQAQCMTTMCHRKITMQTWSELRLIHMPACCQRLTSSWSSTVTVNPCTCHLSIPAHGPCFIPAWTTSLQSSAYRHHSIRSTLLGSLNSWISVRMARTAMSSRRSLRLRHTPIIKSPGRMDMRSSLPLVYDIYCIYCIYFLCLIAM